MGAGAALVTDGGYGFQVTHRQRHLDAVAAAVNALVSTAAAAGLAAVAISRA